MFMTCNNVAEALAEFGYDAPVAVEVSDGQGSMRLCYVEKIDGLVVPSEISGSAQGYARLHVSG
jgi:hypothetical protein